MSNPLVIDCDTGRDDALSIWLALSRQLPLAAVVASYGNTTVSNVVENSARVLALAGRNDVSLWQGADKPSRMHKGVAEVIQPKQDLSGNGLCNLELPKVLHDTDRLSPYEMAERLKDIATQRGAVDYIILGPATNFAAICEALSNRAPEVIASVTMMGGKMDGLWDQMPGADFNIACDPYAARDVLIQGKMHNFPVRFVPMNVTWPIVMPLTELEALSSASEIGKTACALMVAHARYFAPEPVFRFHDPCVILALSHLSAFRPCVVDIICDEASHDFGRIIGKDQGLPACIFEADEAFRNLLLSEILTGLSINRA